MSKKDFMYVIAAIVSLAAIYLMVAFITLSINFTEWSEDERFLYAILSSAVLVLLFLVNKIKKLEF